MSASRQEEDDLDIGGRAETASKPERKGRKRTDGYLWGIYLSLILISLIELYSASSREIRAGHVLAPLMRHAMLLGFGLLIIIGLQRVRYEVFYRYTWHIVILSMIIAVVIMFKGQVINGARRSISLGFFTVQSSELLKFSAALLIARLLGDHQIKVRGRPDVGTWAVVGVGVVVLLFGVMLISQGLTNTLLLMAIALSMMFIGGVSWKKYLIVVGAYAVLGGGYWLVSSMKASDVSEEEYKENPYSTDRSKLRNDRITEFLRKDKYKDPITSENQQAQYSFIAQANGGMTGVGPGSSREAARLPLAFSDYIYAIVIEDLGLIGGLAVMALYLLLLARAGRIGINCKKVFPTLLIIGMAVFIVYQALFHMAIVTGFFPVSGQTLPFISKGGSSVIISSVAFGIMLSVSRYAERKE